MGMMKKMIKQKKIKINFIWESHMRGHMGKFSHMNTKVTI